MSSRGVRDKQGCAGMLSVAVSHRHGWHGPGARPIPAEPAPVPIAAGLLALIAGPGAVPTSLSSVWAVLPGAHPWERCQSPPCWGFSNCLPVAINSHRRCFKMYNCLLETTAFSRW